MPHARRSAVASPLADALHRVGDRWTLLVVAALLEHAKRFNELQEELEGIAPNVLSARLKLLGEQALLVARPYSERPPRFEYELTAAGRELARALRTALDAAMKIDAAEERDQALAEVARNALDIAPDLSAEAIRQLSTDFVDKVPLIKDCVKHLASIDSEQAMKWADSLAVEADIMAAKHAIALMLAESDPAAAANLLSNSGIGIGSPGDAAAQVLVSWVAKAPSDAAAWALASPPGESRKIAIKTVASQWLSADSKAAFTWLGEQRNQIARKDATRAMAEVLTETPEPIRGSFLGEADPEIRSELEQQEAQINQEAEAEVPEE